MFEALGFQELTGLFELGHLGIHIRFDFWQGDVHDFLAGQEVGRREDRNVLQITDHFPGQGIDFPNPVDFIAKEFDPQGLFIPRRREDFHHVTADPEPAALKINVVAVKLNRHQFTQQAVATDFLANPQGDDVILVFGRRPQPKDAGDRSHYDHVVAFQQRRRRRVAQLVNFIVNRGVLFNVGITGRDVGFRLVVIIVRNKVFHRIVGEELFHFPV